MEAVHNKKFRSKKPENSINKNKSFLKSWQLLVMLLPGSIILIINNYLPMLGVIIAFQKMNYRAGLFGGEWVGLKNFEFFLKTSYAPIIIRNTILYNLAFIVLGTIIAVFFAIALNEITRKRVKKIYQSAMFLPYFMSWIVVSYVGYALLGTQFGFINTGILKPLGLNPISFYTEAKYWPAILVIANLWKYGGYNTVIYLAAVAGLNAEYYEAAAIDGASKWKQITQITIPLLSPIIIIMVLLSLGRIFNADFGLFYMLPMNSGPLFPVTNVIDTYVYRAMSSGIGDFSMAAAAGLFQSVVGLIFILSSNLLVKKIDAEKALF